jgi:hypothetical protein
MSEEDIDAHDVVKMALFDHIEAYPYLYALDCAEISSVLMTMISNYCLITNIKPLEFKNQMQQIVLQYRDLYEQYREREKRRQ